MRRQVETRLRIEILCSGKSAQSAQGEPFNDLSSRLFSLTPSCIVETRGPMPFRYTLVLAVVGIFLIPDAMQALSVCADPDYLPYSDRSGAGFENKIAVAIGKLLNEPVQYTWASQRSHGGFLQFLS